MNTKSLLAKRSFWLKFFEIFCLIFVVTGIFEISNFITSWEYAFVTNKTKLSIAIASFISASLIIAFAWQKSGKGNQLHKWFQGIIIFYVAYAISVYGFSKLLKTQFQPPQFILDTPVGDLGGFWLTWVYYGHSQALAYILGATQIAGSILLLFRKTRLAGVFILLPVMVNINLVNHFYDISPLAYYNAMHYTFILAFLLFLDYDKLKIVFSYAGTMRLNLGSGLLNFARIAIISAAFLNIYFLKKGIASKTKLNGVWQVVSIKENNVAVTPNACQDSVWSKLYFEWRYGCYFKYNPDKFEDKDLYGDYKVNEKQHALQVAFETNNNKSDSVLFHYSFINDSLLSMNGNYKTNLVAMQLKRLK